MSGGVNRRHSLLGFICLNVSDYSKPKIQVAALRAATCILGLLGAQTQTKGFLESVAKQHFPKIP